MLQILVPPACLCHCDSAKGAPQPCHKPVGRCSGHFVVEYTSTAETDEKNDDSLELKIVDSQPYSEATPNFDDEFDAVDLACVRSAASRLRDPVSRGYFAKTPIPEEVAPEEIVDMIIPPSAEKNCSNKRRVTLNVDQCPQVEQSIQSRLTTQGGDEEHSSKLQEGSFAAGRMEGEQALSEHQWPDEISQRKRKPARPRCRSQPVISLDSEKESESDSHTSGLSTAIVPGDVLNIRGDDASSLTRLGSSGGLMGHVLVVVSQPSPVKKWSPEGVQYQELWPRSARVLWRVGIIESCRSTRGLHETHLLLFVDESQKMFCCGEVEGSNVYGYECKDQIHLWSAPQQLRGRNFRLDLMNQVLTDMRASQGTWSWSTAVRAFLASGDLSLPDQQPTMQDIQDAWRVNPICTSIVVIFWQQYLQRLAEVDSVDALPLILRYMPLRADCVLPGELLSKMLSCGWSTCEVVHGHRPKRMQTQRIARPLTTTL